MTTTPTDLFEGATGFRPHSYGSRCEGKRPDKQDGKRAIKWAERTSVGRMSAYRCPHCDAWPMGHSPAPTLLKSAYVCPTVDRGAASRGGQRCG